MAGGICAVYGCNNYHVKNSSKSFFSFPRDITRYKMPFFKSTHFGARKKPCRRRKLIPTEMYKKKKESGASVFNSLDSSNSKQLKSSCNSEKEIMIATRQTQSSETGNEDIKPKVDFYFTSSDSSTSVNTIDQLLSGLKFHPLKPHDAATTTVNTENPNCCSSSNISILTPCKTSPLPATRKYNTRSRAVKPASSLQRKNITLKTCTLCYGTSCVKNINKSELPQRVEKNPVNLIPECESPILEEYHLEHETETENSDLLNKDVRDAPVFDDCVEASKTVGTPSFTPHKIPYTSTPNKHMPNFDFVFTNENFVSVMNDNGQESLKNCSNKETPVLGDNKAMNEHSNSCHFGTQYQGDSQISYSSEDIFKSYENNGSSTLWYSPDTAAMNDFHPASCSMNKPTPFQNDTPSHSEVGSEHDNVTSVPTAAEYVRETSSNESVKDLRLRSGNIKIQKNKQLSFENYLSESGKIENSIDSMYFDATYESQNELVGGTKCEVSNINDSVYYDATYESQNELIEGTKCEMSEINDCDSELIQGIENESQNELIGGTKLEMSDIHDCDSELIQGIENESQNELIGGTKLEMSDIHDCDSELIQGIENSVYYDATYESQNELIEGTKCEMSEINDCDSELIQGIENESQNELIGGTKLEMSDINDCDSELIQGIENSVYYDATYESQYESKSKNGSEENQLESDIQLKQLLQKEQSKVKNDDLENNSAEHVSLKKSADIVTTRRRRRRYTHHIILDNQSRKSILGKAVEYASRVSLINRPSTMNTSSSALTSLPVFQNVEEECKEKEDKVAPSVPLSDDLDSGDDQLKDADDTTRESELPRKSSNVESETIHEVDSANESETGEKEVLSPEEIILQKCQQEAIVPFPKQFPNRLLQKCKKIGEGTFGEVFCYKDKYRTSVFKIIPVEGDKPVNGEPQKKYMEILPEILISQELSNLRKGELNKTDRFAEVISCLCVKGCYPRKLISLWKEYKELNKTDNKSPSMFGDDQIFIVLELAHGGTDLENYSFKSAEQVVSVFKQITYALAVAENSLQFEHRDLHWGNVLISETDAETVTFSLNGDKYDVPTKGVLVTIIDFTLSRMTYDGCFIFTNLLTDETLFDGEGDYQFDTYRMMHNLIKDDCSHYVPRTNVVWLNYILHKMKEGVKYKSARQCKSVRSRPHKNGLEELNRFYEEILLFQSAVDIVKKLLN